MLLEISQLYFSHSADMPLFRNFNLQVEEGQTIALAGESGCGKATLWNLIYGLLKRKKGEIILPVNALVLDENSIKVFDLDKPVCFFGDGMPKAKELLPQIKGATFLENIVPSSKSLAALAFAKLEQNKFENVSLFEPFYLKEFFTKSA